MIDEITKKFLLSTLAGENDQMIGSFSCKGVKHIIRLLPELICIFVYIRMYNM